jgi:penicillin-binding protein 1A
MWYLENYELVIDKAGGGREYHSREKYREFFLQTDRTFNMLYNTQEEAYEAIEYYKSMVMEEGDAVLSESINLPPQPQTSITVTDQHTGHVLAMVGGRGAKTGSRTLNRAVATTRQPGSTYKVLAVYAPALDSAGMTLASVQNDAPFNYNDGTPVNNWWGDSYRGLNSYRIGIYNSMNIIAVKTLTQITPQLGFDYLLNFGFTTLVERRELTVGGQTQIYSDIIQSLALGGIT